MSHTERVFVYGTLRPPRPDTPIEDSRNYLQIAPYVQAAAPAHLSGAELYDLGPYPAARPGQGVVQGDLLTVESAALTIMDRIEEHPTFFQRGRVLVHTETGPTKAWIYWSPERLVTDKHRIVSGDWFQREA
jgi:gamma-glutamylcyclotransferase (GGCT)/AIG2-like uncharacterized protein YtfP